MVQYGFYFLRILLRQFLISSFILIFLQQGCSNFRIFRNFNYYFDPWSLSHIHRIITGSLSIILKDWLEVPNQTIKDLINNHETLRITKPILEVNFLFLLTTHYSLKYQNSYKSFVSMQEEQHQEDNDWNWMHFDLCVGSIKWNGLWIVCVRTLTSGLWIAAALLSSYFLSYLKTWVEASCLVIVFVAIWCAC